MTGSYQKALTCPSGFCSHSLCSLRSYFFGCWCHDAKRTPSSCTICGRKNKWQAISISNVYLHNDDLTTDLPRRCNDVRVAFKDLRIFNFRCPLCYPTMSRVAFELLFLSKMFECCYDRILRLSVEEGSMLVIKESYKFDIVQDYELTCQLMTVSDHTCFPISSCDDGVLTQPSRCYRLQRWGTLLPTCATTDGIW